MKEALVKQYGEEKGLEKFWFQSPCGEVVMKAAGTQILNPAYAGFQSPCGEVVMKGVAPTPAVTPSPVTVSVPLRGSGDESLLVVLILWLLVLAFQSPCGEVVMKALKRVGGVKHE